ncbi:hypothetical protein NMY22_g16145 [Coprinellus aureogranulatus]|nr:hypothetical protein NMY22_g16145 [Coprinellus aureogranulatus]
MKALFPVGRHKIDDFWEDSLADEVPKRLNALNIKWKSVDIVRIATRDESGRCDPQKAPVVLWVGVAPGFTSCEKGRKAAFDVRDLLLEKGIDDVDVELREVVMWPDIRNEV